MQNEMPCDFLGAERQAMSQERRDDAAREAADRTYINERSAFLAAVGNCSLKLPRSGQTLWDCIFDNLLYLDQPEIWELRRAMFDALKSSPAGALWLENMAEFHARKEADEAETEYEE